MIALTVACTALHITLATPLGQGQGFASYFISVQNVGTAASSGVVTVADILPSGLTATNINGGGASGWNCTLATLTCTISTTVAAGGFYPGINLFVSVDPDAPASVMNQVSVASSGDFNPANNSISSRRFIR